MPTESLSPVSRATLLAADIPTLLGSGLFPRMYTGNSCSGSPHSCCKDPGDSYALSTRNRSSQCGEASRKHRIHVTLRFFPTQSWCCCLPGSLVPAGQQQGRLGGGGRWGELIFNNQFIQEKRILSPPLVFLKQKWQVIRAGGASGSYSAANCICG